MRKRKFFVGQKLSEEENYLLEFKEIKGNNPIDTIKNTCDEYVVAFLNYRGGKIIWGITDSDKTIVGVKLSTSKIRDELQKAIDNKLSQIKPQISPTAYKVFFHKVFENDKETNDLYLVEISAEPPLGNLLYATSSGEVFIKTRSGKEKLSHEKVLDEHRRRIELDRLFNKKQKKLNTSKNQSAPLTNPQVFEISFDNDGAPIHEDKELWAIGAEAYFFSKTNQPISFHVSLQKINTLNKELLLYSNRELSHDERISKIHILDETESLKKIQTVITRTLELLFHKEIRYYVSDPYEIGLVIKGLGNRVLGKFRHPMNDQGLDIWRKDYKGIGTAIWVPRDDLGVSIQRLIWASEADIYDLGQKNMMEIATPAILLEVVRIEPDNQKINLSDLLKLSKWSIGAH